MSDKMREEFEAWAPIKHSHYLYPFNRIDGEDRYVHPEVQQDWAVWKASRESLVIELSPYISYDRELCIEAIEVAGLKVKP